MIYKNARKLEICAPEVLTIFIYTSLISVRKVWVVVGKVRLDLLSLLFHPL